MPASAEDRGDLTDEQKLAELEQPDTKLATEIPDEATRQRQMTEAFGGEVDDIDSEDVSAADRGDNLEPETTSEDRGDEVEPEEKSEESEEASSDDEAEGSDDDGADEEAEEADADADSDSGEESDSDDEGDDGDDDVDVTDDDDDEKAEKGIPRHRFNEVNEARKAAQAELAELKAQQAAKQDATEDKFDFDKAEGEYMELLLDGKTAEAGAKRAEIRAAEREKLKAEAKAETLESVDEQASIDELKSLAAQAEEMFPIFNQNHEDFDPAAAEEVMTWMNGYIANGKAPGDAFVSAIAVAIKQFGLESDEDAEKDPEPDPDPKPKVKKKAPIRKVKEKTKAAKQQAPPAGVTGEASSDAGAAVPNIEQLSDEEIDALPAETLARLRGDFI